MLPRRCKVDNNDKGGSVLHLVGRVRVKKCIMKQRATQQVVTKDTNKDQKWVKDTGRSRSSSCQKSPVPRHPAIRVVIIQLKPEHGQQKKSLSRFVTYNKPIAYQV